jgi:hypothetical protein
MLAIRALGRAFACRLPTGKAAERGPSSTTLISSTSQSTCVSSNDSIPSIYRTATIPVACQESAIFVSSKPSETPRSAPALPNRSARYTANMSVYSFYIFDRHSESLTLDRTNKQKRLNLLFQPNASTPSAGAKPPRSATPPPTRSATATCP